MHLVGRGGQIRLTVTFYELAGGDTYDPEGVSEPTLEIWDSDEIKVGPLSYASAGPVTKVSKGVYTYTWDVPLDEQLGEHTARWAGTVYGNVIEAQETFSVIGEGAASTGITTGLDEDYFVTFLAELDPMYIGVDELKPLFTEADDIEIAEAIHLASLEVDHFFPDVAEPPISAVDYVKAATACSLSRVYEYGFGGAEMAVRLGDLSISSRPVGAKAVSRGTAASWCELAAALREEMLKDSVVGGKAGMKAANKGSAYWNPMPARHIRRHD